MAESEEERKSFLMKVQEEWKTWIKIQHSKTKIPASGSIMLWEIDGETVEADFISDFLFQTLFLWAPKSLQMVIAAIKLKDAYSLEGILDSIL